MKRNRHVSPMSYRIIFRSGNWVMKSKQYYNVYHSSEAFEDIYHTFNTGKIHAKKITIYKIEEHERFTKKWLDRTDKVIEYITSQRYNILIINNKKIVLERNGGEK